MLSYVWKILNNKKKTELIKLLDKTQITLHMFSYSMRRDVQGLQFLQIFRIVGKEDESL